MTRSSCSRSDPLAGLHLPAYSNNRDTCLSWPSPRQVTDNQTDETKESIHATNQRHASTPDVIRCCRQELVLLDIIATSIKVKYSYVNTPYVARCSRQEVVLLGIIATNIKVKYSHANTPDVARCSQHEKLLLDIIATSIKVKHIYVNIPNVAGCLRHTVMLLNTIEFSIKVTDIHVNIPGVAGYSQPDIVPLNIIDASIKATDPHRGRASTQDVARWPRAESVLIDIIATCIKVKNIRVNIPNVAGCSHQTVVSLNIIEMFININENQFHVNTPDVTR